MISALSRVKTIKLLFWYHLSVSYPIIASVLNHGSHECARILSVVVKFTLSAFVTGINIFLDGFVPTENLRFRESSLVFKVAETADKVCNAFFSKCFPCFYLHDKQNTVTLYYRIHSTCIYKALIDEQGFSGI